MRKVLILSVPGDGHGRAVEWAISRRRFATPVYILTSDIPSKASISISVDAGTTECALSSEAGDIARASEGLSVWRRRIGTPLPAAELSPADYEVCIKETECVRDAALHLFETSGAFCVNPESAATVARLKPLQLRAAKNVGLHIPETLISNDPALIRSFATAQGGGIIIKSLTSPSWAAGKMSFAPFTVPVAPSVLENDEVLHAAPAIYQRSVPKQHEIRALVMGNTVISIGLYSQDNLESSNDWRAVSVKKHRVAAIELPRDVREKCIELIRRLGLYTGSIDLIFDTDGNYIFLEVNEMGQFLWIEEVLPELPVLQAFSDFLAEGRPDFSWAAGRDESVSFAAYLRSGHWQQSLATEKSLHRHYNYFARKIYHEDAFLSSPQTSAA